MIYLYQSVFMIKSLGNDNISVLAYLLYLFGDCNCAIEHSTVYRSILRQLSNSSLNRCVFKIVLKGDGGSGRTDIGGA